MSLSFFSSLSLHVKKKNVVGNHLRGAGYVVLMSTHNMFS